MTTTPTRSQTSFHVYDTTLRDGAQQEGLNLSVGDKLAIAELLDELGVTFIEGGWPGANPKDTEFFARARAELRLQTATLAAFGATRRAGVAAAEDPQVLALLNSGAPVVTLVGKAHTGHVAKALKTTPEENLAMVGDTVAFLVGSGRRVFLDAEHYFDGYRLDREYALNVVRVAIDAGAELVALCDTNGGMLPPQVGDIVAATIEATGARVGIHCHNDTGCAVANSLAAVQAGATHFQGCVNGYGERTGNADLLTTVANLQIKLGQEVIDPQRLSEATRIAHAIAEITNVAPFNRQPYVGVSAFAHKAGLHASALKVDADMYQHTDPKLVGNDMRMLVSDMAGRASIEMKGRELGYDLSGRPDLLSAVVARVKELELRGYTFDAADASFELLLHEQLDGKPLRYFEVESWRVIADSSYRATGRSGPRGEEINGGVAVPAAAATSEATVKLTAGGRRTVATGEGNGPVNALDHALREALTAAYPELEKLTLVDYRVRILDSSFGSDAVTRVVIEVSDGVSSWHTVGVAPNIVEASWIALVDGLTYGLHRHGVPIR